MARSHRSIVLLAAAAVPSAMLAANALASIQFNQSGSSLFIIHDIDISNSASQRKNKEVLTIPSSGNLPIPPSYQLSNTFNQSTGSSTARGSLGHVTNATTASFVLAAGSGVTQSDPGDVIPGQSNLRFNVDLRWNTSTGGFGPVNIGYISVAVGAVVGQGGSAQYRANLNFTDPTTGTVLRDPYVFTQTYNTPGTFTQVFTNSQPLDPLFLPAGRQVRINGFVEFRASNEEEPTSIIPLNSEFGGAPPTFTFIGGPTAFLGDARSWDVGAVPGQSRGAADRIRLININEAPAEIMVDTPTSISTLDIDSPQPYRLTQTANGFINLALSGEQEGRNAVINVRNVSGNAGHVIATPMALSADADFRVDSDPGDGVAGLRVMETIGGSQSLIKSGKSMLALETTNSYAGGTFIQRGELSANASRALGSNSITVTNGQLNYNAIGAAAPETEIVMQRDGMLNLGVADLAGEVFDVRTGGGVRGDSSELGMLSVGQNLLLADRAMIAHDEFEPGVEGNPRGLGNSPRYIFGISEDFANNTITIGSQSDSPWIGFGSDRGDRTFGGGEGDLFLAGDAELVTHMDGVLRINSGIREVEDVPENSITKTGFGKLKLNADNTFNGPTRVETGGLFVNGSLPGSVDVEDLGVLGGSGTIGGVVRLLPGVRFVDTDDRTPGSTIQPGDEGAGMLSIGGLVMSPDSRLEVELGAPNTPGKPLTSDLLVVNGDAVLDGFIDIVELDGFIENGVYEFLQVKGNVTGAGLKVGLIPSLYDIDVVIVPGPDGGSIIGLNVIPEPSSLAVGLLSLGLLARRQRAARR